MTLLRRKMNWERSGFWVGLIVTLAACTAAASHKASSNAALYPQAGPHLYYMGLSIYFPLCLVLVGSIGTTAVIMPLTLIGKVIDRVIVDNPLGKAVLSLLLCQPFGLVAIIHALNVNVRMNKGDVEGAQVSAENASFWANIAIGFGVVGVVLTVASYLLTLFSRT